MSTQNFKREYRLSAGPVGGVGFEIGETSSSRPVPLHVSFGFEKTDLETQNTGTISVWNLSPEHLSILSETDCLVSLTAGYGARRSLIFAGIVSHVETKMSGADRETQIEVVDNLVEVRDTYVSIAYKGVVNWKTIFDDVANQMGVAVSYAYNVEFIDVSNGYSYVGQAKTIMSKGCACCGLTWSLQNGVMQVKKPGDVMSTEVYLLSSETGLVGIPTRVTETSSDAGKGTLLGWDVQYFLNGAISIDDYVKLESQTVTGYFRVYSLSIEGDNVSGDWMCTARLMEVKS